MKTIAVVLSLLLFSTVAYAADAVTATVTAEFPKTDNAVVVELFTSQGCSSCPPAQEYLLDLAKRPDVLPLEFHVDYWDQLKTWTGGAWKDPFSDSAWSKRQVDYNTRIMNEDRAFTPQIIIDGAYQDVGSRRDNIDALIAESASLKRRPYKISGDITADGNLTVKAAGPGIPKPAQVVLLRLLKNASTDVRGGENKGATMKGVNVVRSLLTIGTWTGGNQQYKFNLPSFKADESCAVLLQDPDSMHILAGGICHL